MAGMMIGSFLIGGNLEAGSKGVGELCVEDNN